MATGWALGGIGAPTAGYGLASHIASPAPQTGGLAVSPQQTPDVDVRALASAVANAMAGAAKTGVSAVTAPTNGTPGAQVGVAPLAGAVGNAVAPNPGLQMQVAAPSGITVSDCQHSSVNQIVNGQYQRAGENHGMPVYKKPTQGGGSTDVLVYYWDTRDGPNFSGWYFGPSVGGDQVWAHHPGQTDNSQPPPGGWCVPFGGAVDPGLKVTFVTDSVKRPAADEVGSGAEQPMKIPRVESSLPPEQQNNLPPQQQNNLPPQQQNTLPPQPSATALALLGGGPQTQDPQNAGMSLLPNQPPPPPSPQQMLMQQQMQLQQHKNLQRQQQLLAMYPQLAFNPLLLQQYVAQMQLQEDAQKLQLEALRKQKEEEAKKKAEENQQRIIEMRKRMASEHEACAKVRRMMQKCRIATPETYEQIKKDLEEVLEKEKEQCGSQFARIKTECDTILTQAQKSVEAILKHRQMLADKKAEEERKKKELDERVAKLQKELTDLSEESDSTCGALKDLAKPLSAVSFAEDQNINDEEIAKLVADVAVKCKDAEATNKRSTTYIMQNGPELKALGPNMVKANQPSGVQSSLGRLLKSIQDLSQATVESQKVVSVCEVGLLKRRKAKEFIAENNRLFSLYDKDADGMLSRKEAKRYSNKEFGFLPPNEALDRVWKHNVDISEETLEEKIGIKRECFRWLQLAIGVSRELARNEKRKEERLDREKVLVGLKENLKPGMAEATRAANRAEATIVNAEKKIVPLKVVTADVEAMSTLGEEAEAAIEEGRSIVAAVRKHIENLAIEGIELRCREHIQAFLKHELRRVEMQLGRMETRLQRASRLMDRFRKNVLYKQGKALREELEKIERAKWEEEKARWVEAKAREAEERARAQLEAAETAKATPQAEANACVCGAPCGPDDKFCMKCGAKLPEPKEEAPPVSMDTEAEAEAEAGREAWAKAVAAAAAAKAAETLKAPENGESETIEIQPEEAQMEVDKEEPRDTPDVIRIPDGGGEDEADIILQSVAKNFIQV